jgi:hypothetical protein
MAVGDGVTWNEALPDNSTLAHQIDDYNRDLRLGVRNRMAREHIWPSSQTGTNEGGHHQFITFQQQTSAPALSTATGLTQVGALFVGSSGDGYPLCFENSAGTTFPIITAVSSIGTFTYGMAVVSSGTLGSIPICSSANPSTLTLLAGPTSTTNTVYMLVSSNNATGGVTAPIWSKPTTVLTGTGNMLNATNLTAIFGDWVSKNNNQVYQADTDGFVIGYRDDGNGVVGYTDSSNPPTTKRASNYNYAS